MPKRSRPIEWPTWGLWCVVHAGWLILTWQASRWPVVCVLGAWWVAWHGSLQHELVHGHPTRSRRLNALLGSAPLGLWLPFLRYRQAHLAHHQSTLTDPRSDPESAYVLPEAWERASRLTRALLWTQTTVLGRFVLGPALVVGQSLRAEWTGHRGQRAAQLACWLPHCVGVAGVLAWVSGVCGIPAWVYVLAWAYPGLGLTLLRSFNEHRADPNPELRTVLVEQSRLLRWLYLNNDLHVVHHRYPQLPWYELPGARRHEPDLPGYRQRSYLQVVWRHLIRPRGSPVFPLVGSAEPGGSPVFPLVGSAELRGSPVHPLVGSAELGGSPVFPLVGSAELRGSPVHPLVGSAELGEGR